MQSACATSLQPGHAAKRCRACTCEGGGAAASTQLLKPPPQTRQSAAAAAAPGCRCSSCRHMLLATPPDAHPPTPTPCRPSNPSKLLKKLRKQRMAATKGIVKGQK